MSSVELATHNTAAAGPVTSRSSSSGAVSSAIPISGGMVPPITWEDAAKVEPIDARLVAG